MPPRKKPAAKTTAPQPNTPRFELTEIPRRRLSNGKEGGPLLIPPGQKRSWGDKKCETCGRMVEKSSRAIRKGKCTCFYYKRTTTFIDVLQDEYLLKQWGNRNVAWGVAQRPDLVLAAAACKPDADDEQPAEDKSELNRIAKEAQDFAGSRVKASIGTSLHKLTHQLDRGETLGYVPDRWVDDIKAYEAWKKESGVEWVAVEAFRCFDNWMVKGCKHYHPLNKNYEAEPCHCVGVAGTVDRIGWYKGRLTIFDIKTGSTFNKQGHAMQLAFYARMVPYIIATDERAQDVSDVNLNIGYIIALPEGKGQCELEPLDIGKGWGACNIAKSVWSSREQDYGIRDGSPLLKYGPSYKDLAGQASSRKELKVIADNAKQACALTSDLKDFLNRRWTELGA